MQLVGLLQALIAQSHFCPKKYQFNFLQSEDNTFETFDGDDWRHKLLPTDKFMGSPVKVLNCSQTFSFWAILLQNRWLEKSSHSNMKFKQKAKHSIILDMLKFQKKILQEIFVLRKMRHLLNYSGKFYVSKSKFQD